MTRSVSRLSLTLVLLATLPACEGMKSLLALQQGLASEFGAREVGVNLVNGKVLVITFQNSSLGDLVGEEQAELCHRVGEYVRDHYSGYAHLQQIRVAFSKQAGFGPVNLTRSQTPCALGTDQLGQPHAPRSPADSARRAA